MEQALLISGLNCKEASGSSEVKGSTGVLGACLGIKDPYQGAASQCRGDPEGQAEPLPGT